MKRATGSLLVAALVLLAGCAGGVDMGDSSSPTAVPSDTEPIEGTTGGSPTGTLDFYVSDRPNAIGDFDRLNVTIDRVELIRAAEDDNGTDERTESNGSELTEDQNETTTLTGSATVTSTATADDARPGDENESLEEGEDGRVVLDAGNRTVDLTRLVGANATLIGQFDVPAGEYEKVFLHVSDVNATLTNGESQHVKLPSEKLHVNKPFEVGANDSVAFVFDIAVHEAGKSGKYILHPVIGESGTEVPIESIDDDDAEERDGSDARDDEDDREMSDDSSLNVTFEGNVTAGENATVRVTHKGSAVENATVEVNDEIRGLTDEAGRLTVHVPTSAEELEISVEHGDAEAEREIEFENESRDDEVEPDSSDEGDET